MDLAYIGTIILLILGFGFVVFWHELGHFIAAKWAGVKVEQFAVGFGQAIVSYRKGLGWRWGSSNKEYEQLLRSDRAGTERIDPQTLGETEYRLNWLPLGGYVKMLGQDDLRPNAAAEDPRAYNNKPIGHRMVIVSAGVIMNVILAAILFMVLFLVGFRSQPAVVGSMVIGSPAQNTVRPDGSWAPLEPGDRILYFGDRYQHDFTKITLAVALAGPGQTEMYVRRLDGTEEMLLIEPARADADGHGFLVIGLGLPAELKGPDPRRFTAAELASVADRAVRPGETIVAVQGQPVVVGDPDRYDYWILDRALQQSFGRPVEITVRDANGNQQRRLLHPQFAPTFGRVPLSFAGMVPRTAVGQLSDDSAAEGMLQPGDVVLKIITRPHFDTEEHPTQARVMALLAEAGTSDRVIDMVVLRDGEEIQVSGLRPDRKLETATGRKFRGLGIGIDVDANHPVIADIVADSAAQRAGIPRHSTIQSINGEPIKTWFDVHRSLSGLASESEAVVEVRTRDGVQQTITMPVTAETVRSVAQIRYAHDLPLAERIEPRKTNNPFVAAAWGVTDTRDLIIQFYLTLQRMVQGSISPTNLMGPIGIVSAGSRIAYRGHDWLLWFLAMISANLAVVNFLPIPIVDGGLFVFLILEKLMGRPLSQRAQSIAQIVGLALILSVFLFVTYQDIARIF